MVEKLVQAINVQINDEFDSAFLYLAMAAYSEGELNLPGFAHWLRKQYEEELSHAARLFDFLIDRRATPSVRGVGSPKSDFGTPKDLFEAVLKNEEMVTKLIHKLYEMALKENDYALQVELQWFIVEQVEEEKSASDILDRVKIMVDASTGLLLIDSELAKR